MTWARNDAIGIPQFIRKEGGEMDLRPVSGVSRDVWEESASVGIRRTDSGPYEGKGSEDAGEEQ